MNGMTSYILSKKYVESTVDSLGSLKGAPCTIKSQTETDDSYIVTFEWTGTSGGYISKMMITDNGLIPVIASGSATTYYCDGLWFNNSRVDYALVGGASSDTSHVGTLCSDFGNASSNTYWSIGAAISCKPLAKSS